MKCKNCGAELNNGKCEYCGSVFLEKPHYTMPMLDFEYDVERLQRFTVGTIHAEDITTGVINV